MDSDPDRRRRPARRHLQQALGVTLIAALGLLVIGALGQQLRDPHWSAMFAVVAALSVALVIATLVALGLSWTYLDDARDLGGLVGSVWPYVVRSAGWGLAAGGIGALLATALPPRIAGAFAGEPSRLPVGGWLTVAFAGIGLAIGVLEEWRQQGDD